jgi:hypothetical protein
MDDYEDHPFAPPAVAPGQQLPAAPIADPFLAYGLASSRDGTLLKFAKEGAWKAGLGDEAVTLTVGTKLMARMEPLAYVWTRWQNGKQTDGGRRVTLVSTSMLPPARQRTTRVA